MRSFAMLALVALTAAVARADTPEELPVGPACTCAPPPETRPVLEITFGSSQLFDHQSLLTNSGRVERRVIPISSALLMIEWLFHERFSVLSLFNLPLTTAKVVANGESREEFVAPSLALGVRASLLRIQVFKASHLELQAAALGGLTLGSTSGDVVFPLAAGRIHFSNPRGFALYLGSAFAFRKDTVAVLYGIGYRF